jgi:phospholipid transport system substrate-binding protein
MKSIVGRITIISMLFVLLLSGAWASSSPIPMLQNTADQVISVLKAHKNQLKNNPNISYNAVVHYVVPVVDQQAMAQAVVGRNAWGKATSAQRTEFIKEFRILVTRTYASAFSEFSNERVVFQPIRGSVNQSMLQVQSKIISNVRPSVDLNYTLVNHGAGWKITDFSVDGISMIQSFRSQFLSTLAQSGMSGLIQELASHNKKLS